MYTIKRQTFWQKVMALVLCIGALPILFSASAYACETGAAGQSEKIAGEAVKEESPKSKADWLWEDYRKPVGLTYFAQVSLNSMYNWRGTYSGGLNMQPVASVGYGGAYIETWWNLGSTDWKFTGFLPEMDWKIGFNRWGLDLSLLYVHFLDRTDLDLGLYSSNSMELALRYTLSNKVPLSILWGTRVAGFDGYENAAGDTVRAYSTYIEISYTQYFKYGLSLYGAFGFSPWRSLYSGFTHNFTAQNIDIRLRKDWDVSTHCGLMLRAQFTIIPWLLAEDTNNAKWNFDDPFDQAINLNLSFGVYLK